MFISKKVKTVVPIVVLILTIIIGFLYGVKYEKSIKPSIKLNGANNVVLSLNEEYTDEGVNATFKKNDISNLVKINGQVDNTNVGTYEVVYEVNYNNKSVKATRTITVVDVTSPEISLNGETSISMYKGDTYTEQGVKATDNYDGDISDKVSVEGSVDSNTIGTYELTYNIEDSSGNKNSIKRTVNVVERPVVYKSSTTSYVSGSSETLPVLMYHFFYDDTKGETGNDANWMAITDFENQMRYLSDNNFYFPSWEEVEDFVDGKISLPANSVVVTIDDGDRSFINLAIPVIEKYNVKVTSFVVGCWTAGEIYGLHNPKVDVQAHSFDAHRAGKNGKGLLVNMTYDQVKTDAQAVSDVIGGSTVFCYPFGHYNDTVISALKDTGYHMAFTTAGGYVKPGQDKMKLPRVRMSRGISLSSFAKKVA